MLGNMNLPRNSLADQQFFFTNNSITTTLWQVWRKRPGISMVSVFCLGPGGGGGNGAVGANSTAAGGGGGGSGGQTYVEISAWLLPEILYISVPTGGTTGATPQATFVSFTPDPFSFVDMLVIAQQGGSGGNASGATAGAAGLTAGAASNSTMSRGYGGFVQVWAGQAGIIGGTTGAAGALSLVTTGLRVTGGTGGAGLGAAAAAGTAGGGIGGAGILPTITGAAGGSSATTPPANGSNGIPLIGPYAYFYGGTGGGSTHGSATGAGLVQSKGGDGAYGCGGGGSGGALTASTAGAGGKGGDGLVIITSW